MSNIFFSLIQSTKRILDDFVESSVQDGTIYYTGKYEGYYMKVNIENGNRQGEGIIYTKDHCKYINVTYVDNCLQGPFLIRSPIGTVIFEGYLKDGFVDGACHKYNENEEEEFFGFYRAGVCYSRLKKSNTLDGFWEEIGILNSSTSNENELFSICEYNECFERNGVCIEFENNQIRYIKIYKDGTEERLVKEFSSGNVTEYDENGNIRYIGQYLDDVANFYPRNGKGVEYADDGETKVYDGYFEANIRNGNGCYYKFNQLWYKGEWSNNLPNGMGILYGRNSKAKYEGKWINGILYNKLYKINYQTGKKILSLKSPIEQPGFLVCSCCENDDMHLFYRSKSVPPYHHTILDYFSSIFLPNFGNDCCRHFLRVIYYVLFLLIITCSILCSVYNNNGYASLISWISFAATFVIFIIYYCCLNEKNFEVIYGFFLIILSLCILFLFINVVIKTIQIDNQDRYLSSLIGNTLSSIQADPNKWITVQNSLACCGFQENFQTGLYCNNTQAIDCYEIYLSKWSRSYWCLCIQYFALLPWSNLSLLSFKNYVKSNLDS